ncbi:unnamed protein product [Alternaria burnsii]|nr:unnamed protein product [Alternaria burnsii]
MQATQSQQAQFATREPRTDKPPRGIQQGKCFVWTFRKIARCVVLQHKADIIPPYRSHSRKESKSSMHAESVHFYCSDSINLHVY